MSLIPVAIDIDTGTDQLARAHADRIGLFNRVVADDRLQIEAFTLARSLANVPVLALRQIKKNLDEAASIDFDTALVHEAEGIVKLAATDDHREAVQAFIEKRKPVFTGR